MVYFFLFVFMMISSYFTWDLSVFLLVFCLFYSAMSLEGACYSYLVSFNSFSVGLILLSFFICIFMLYCSITFLKESFFWGEFCFTVFSITLTLYICFSVSNFFLFYIMFELVVIPTFFLIMGWGYSVERFQAAMYMFMFTLVGSLPFFLFLLKFYLMGVILNYEYMYFYVSACCFNSFWWFFSTLVFMIKFPIYFFHIWLPKAHVEAPVSGSMILAAVLLKLGGYGFFKLSYFFHMSSMGWTPLFFSLSLFGSFYISMGCLRQSDLKSLVAYSSVSHMGPTFCSILSLSYLGWSGSFFMMISHGICSSGLFYGLGLMYNRWSSRSFLVLKGLMLTSPVMSFWWFAMCAGNMACPPSINFFSELMMFFSLVSWEFSSFLIICLVLLLSGIYSIYLFVSLVHASFVGVNVPSELSILENFAIFFHCFPVYFMFIFMNFLS
uniref:NADH dehydrogenase subunit 4 n=1 Tax=Halotydeus destructor TaxID=2874060 RepID=UPI002028C7CB|nr:NADH dehydrogenase subunit 4 [Halotydeus destructor]UPN63259.1 NADH dehydrogenase subunit 4 [Halotydeus destructor]